MVLWTWCRLKPPLSGHCSTSTPSLSVYRHSSRIDQLILSWQAHTHIFYILIWLTACPPAITPVSVACCHMRSSCLLFLLNHVKHFVACRANRYITWHAMCPPLPYSTPWRLKHRYNRSLNERHLRLQHLYLLSTWLRRLPSLFCCIMPDQSDRHDQTASWRHVSPWSLYHAVPLQITSHHEINNFPYSCFKLFGTDVISCLL